MFWEVENIGSNNDPEMPSTIDKGVLSTAKDSLKYN